MIIAVLGLHFIPLAWLFANWPHYVTGAALLVLAVVYPQAASLGPLDPVGFFGTGAILWASAAWATRRFQALDWPDRTRFIGACDSRRMQKCSALVQ